VPCAYKRKTDARLLTDALGAFLWLNLLCLSVTVISSTAPGSSFVLAYGGPPQTGRARLQTGRHRSQPRGTCSRQNISK